MNEAARRLWIVRNPSDDLVASGPVGWASQQLRDALDARGIPTDLVEHLSDALTDGVCVAVAGRTAPMTRELVGAAGTTVPDAAEALGLISGRLASRDVVLATGSDVRGLVYAVLELADVVACETDPLQALRMQQTIVERPANPIRGVARLFVSEVEDKPWFYDRESWRRYLSMLVSHRFNRIQLALGMGVNFLRTITDAYFLFPYPFLVAVPGYNVRALGLADEERERNLDTLRFVSDQAAACGLHFELGLWTHGYAWVDSPNAAYLIDGLTQENRAAYCRDAVCNLLKACPGIAGLTFRVHGESGVPEGSYDFWKEVFRGAMECGRRVELDLHPKGVDRQMIDVALQTGLSVNISPKYTAEHMGLPGHQVEIRPHERVPVGGDDSFMQPLMKKSFGALNYTRYGYADFLEEDREYGVFYRIWPGTQRLLLWGDPALAAGFGRQGSFCGCLGVEICEPLSFKGRFGSGLPGGRDAYTDATLRPAQGDWEKYLYAYRLFGRLLYNPNANPASWRRYLAHEFGPAERPIEAALASASRVLPLVTSAHSPSADNISYWPEMYTNMPIVDESRPHPYPDTPTPKRFGTLSALDPACSRALRNLPTRCSAASAAPGTPRCRSPAGLTSWQAPRGSSCPRRNGSPPTVMLPPSGAWPSTSPSRPGSDASSHPNCAPRWRTRCSSGRANRCGCARRCSSTPSRAQPGPRPPSTHVSTAMTLRSAASRGSVAIGRTGWRGLTPTWPTWTPSGDGCASPRTLPSRPPRRPWLTWRRRHPRSTTPMYRLLDSNRVKWQLVEPQRGVFDYTAADGLVQFAREHDQVVRGHTLVWHNQVPRWLTEAAFTTPELADILHEHILQEVSHFRGNINAWDVVNEPFNEDGTWRDTIWLQALGPDYVGLAFRWAQAADPQARFYLNDFNVESIGPKSDAMYALVQDLLAPDTPVHGVGLQAHLAIELEFPSTLRQNLERFAALGVDVAITEADVRMPLPPTPAKLAIQAEYFARLLQACLEVRQCVSFTVWGFTDAHSWVPRAFEGQGAGTPSTSSCSRSRPTRPCPTCWAPPPRGVLDGPGDVAPAEPPKQVTDRQPLIAPARTPLVK